MIRVFACFAALALGACSTGGRCVGEFPYQSAQTLPPPQKVEGLKQPESASALRIPPPPANPVPYAETLPDPEEPGEAIVRCLDLPPALPENAEKKPEPAKS